MRSITVIRPLAAAVLTTSALALAACGGDDPAGASPSASRERQMRDAQLQFAKCMREHGIDMPDPTPGQRGINLRVPKGTSPDKVDAADSACRKYLEKVKPPELSEEQQKEFRDAALANARCMREHGIDMPDPTFDSSGRATIRIRGGQGPGKGGGLDPDSPKFQAAQKACEKFLPKRPGADGGPSTQSSP
jgi:hypothetical protein